MPQFILEYTDNITWNADIPSLQRKVNKTIRGQPNRDFPSGDYARSRSIELKEHRMADGADDYAFVHATLKPGSSCSDAQKKKLCDDLFKVMTLHFTPLFESRYLALSMELYEFAEGTYKHYNVQARFAAQVAEG